MTTETYERIPLTRLHESPLNPRKYFDPVKLAELTESVKAKGIITPLIVRPNASGFEIGAGHRRYKAATAAGLADAPCIVRPMDDAAFIEVLVIENEQRHDLGPLEEAEGYRLLMTKAGYTVDKIAERVGMSVKYVYDRVKLLQLIPEAQQLVRDEKITAGHAILLARLKPEQQKKAIDPEGHALWTTRTSSRTRTARRPGRSVSSRSPSRSSRAGSTSTSASTRRRRTRSSSRRRSAR